MYKRILRSSGRVIVIGDLHGKYSTFLRLLETTEFNAEKDIVISVGDLIDRGEDSLSCLELIEKPWFHAVMGNHEQLAYGSIEGVQIFIDNWVPNGGGWYYDLKECDRVRAEALIRKAYKLPRVIELQIAKKKIVIAHACYPNHNYEHGLDLMEDLIIWHRAEAKSVCDGGEAKALVGVDLAIFGHNPMKEVTTSANKIFIDTHCGYPAGVLSAVIINQNGETEVCQVR
jgi:serine/threonine protein phosphatase 1